MKRFFLALIVMGVLISGVALADSTTLLGMEVEGPDQFLAGQTTVINLTITNNDLEAWFTISILGVPSGWLSPETSLIKVKQGETAVVKIYTTIPKDAQPASYGYDISVTRTADGTRLTDNFVVNIVQRVDAIISNFSLSCMQCDSQLTVTGDVQNIGTKPASLLLDLSYGTEFRNVELGTIDVQSSKKFIETFNVEDLEPGQYKMTVDLMADGKKVYTDSTNFNVITQKNITSTDSVLTTPIGKTVSIEVKNNGNVKDSTNLTFARNSGWWSVFFGEESTTMTASTYYWSLTLEPGESVTVSFYEIYWPVALILLILIIGGIRMYLTLTTIELRKTVRGKHDLRKDHEISAALIIRNHTIPMDTVVARDIVPHGFSVVGTFETLKPLVRKVAEGTELVWRVGSMKANEERVLHYRIKAQKDMYGDIDLPLAAIRAKHGEKSIIKHSNIVELHGMPKEQETKVKVSMSK